MSPKEARSIGRFSVRRYSSKNAQPGDDTTFFVSGMIQERDGALEQVGLADDDGDGRAEIVGVARRAGTGQYRSAHAFTVNEKRVVWRASVADLPKNADPVSTLKKSLMKRE